MADLRFRAVSKNRSAQQVGDITNIIPTGKAWGKRSLIPPKDGGWTSCLRLLDDGGLPIWPLWTDYDPQGPQDRRPPLLEAFLVPERSETKFETRADGITKLLDDNDVPIGIVLSRHNWRVKWDELPAVAQKQLWDTGLYEMKWTDVRGFFERHKDGQRGTTITPTALRRR